MSGLGLLVTASEQAVGKEGSSSNMEAKTPSPPLLSPPDKTPSSSSSTAGVMGMASEAIAAAPKVQEKGCTKDNNDPGRMAEEDKEANSNIIGGERASSAENVGSTSSVGNGKGHASVGSWTGGGSSRDDADAGEEGEGDAAARRGDLELCKRKEASGESLKFSKRAMDRAAAAGHLEMVKWLHGKDLECTTDAMDGAAEGGHLSVVEWLHENRSEGCSLSALEMAAGRGHVKIVQWFYDNNMPSDIGKAMSRAQEEGHSEVVEWLRSHSSNKKPRLEDRSATAAAGAAGQARFTRPAAGPVHPAQSRSAVVGMFGSPFGNFTPVNGIVLPGSTAQAMGPGQQATGVVPTPGAPGPAPRLRSNMLRSPELTLATSGKLSSNDERQLKAVMEFRKAYSAQPLEGSNIPKDPFTLFAVWFEEARIARASEPGAMCLSTVGPTGRPSARYVMLQGFDKRGFVWYTNFESRKSQEMSHNPYGALSFWWSEVQRAVRIEGVVCKVSEKESTEYFQSRPRGSQVGAWALHQSRPVESRGSLETNVKDVQNKFSSMRDVPRPPHFGGFRLRPDRIEFWKGRQTRIHDRIVYVIMDDKWIMQRLQP